MTNSISKELFQEEIKVEKGMAIDTHFWVERNGKIIDPLFPEVERLGVTEKNRVYLHATEDDMFYVLDYLRYNSIMFERVNDNRTLWENRFGYCFVNAMCEIWRNGGELKMGCFGVKRTKTGVYWIYGHPKNTAKEIIVPNDIRFSAYRNSGMTRYVK
jgi:hypothetical protein